MNHHENDISPGPLTEYGFKAGSCCQVNLPENSRTPVKPTAKGQHRLKAKSRIGLCTFDRVAESDVIREKLKRILKTYIRNRDFIAPEINAFSPPDCIAATGYRGQRNWLGLYSENMGTYALKTQICSFTLPNIGECIYLSKNSKFFCRTVYEHLRLIASKQPEVHIASKTLSQRRETKHTKCLVESSIIRKYHTEIGNGISVRFSNN